MKKKLIFSIAAALFSASAFAGGPEMVIVAPSPFSGFYVGGYGSFHQDGFDINTQTNFVSVVNGRTNSIPLNALNAGDSNDDGYYGVRGGWGKVFQDRWYAGAEGWAEFGDSSGNVTVIENPSNGCNKNQCNQVTFNDKGHVGTVWGGAGRIGILLSQTTLAYVKLGAEWGKITASTHGSADNGMTSFGDTSNSEDKVGFIWGFGAEQMVFRDMIGIFGEYTHVDFDSVSTTFTQFLFGPDRNGNSFSIQHTNNVKPEIGAFSGGVNFHFGRWFI